MKAYILILFLGIPLLISGQSNHTYKFVGVGDMMLGTNYPSESYLPPKGTNLFENVESILKSAE